MRLCELSKTPVCIPSSGNLFLNQCSQFQKGEHEVPSSPVISSSPRPPEGILDSPTLFYLPFCLHSPPLTTSSLEVATLQVPTLCPVGSFHLSGGVPFSSSHIPPQETTQCTSFPELSVIPHCRPSLYLLASFEQIASGNLFWLQSVGSMIAHRIMPCGCWKVP